MSNWQALPDGPDRTAPVLRRSRASNHIDVCQMDAVSIERAIENGLAL